MRTFLLKSLLLVASLLAGHVGLAQEARGYGYRDRRYPPLTQMVITGQVQRQDSLRLRPLPGALVSVALPGGPQSARTEANGGFSLTLNATALPDSVAVVAAALGLGSQTIRVKKAAQVTAFFHLHLSRFHTRSAHLARPTLAPPDVNGAAAHTAGAGVAVADANEAAAARTQAFWPPPQCSTLQRLNSGYFAKARTLADVDNILADALDAATYDNLRYYYAPDGFVLITRIEQTTADGVALPGRARWSVQVPEGAGSSLARYLKALFIPASGHFRVIAFAVTTQPIVGYRPAPQEEEARGWLQQGADELDPKVAALPYGASYHCTALIYEFKQVADHANPLVIQDALPARTHLANSRIMAGLPKLTP